MIDNFELLINFGHIDRSYDKELLNKIFYNLMDTRNKLSRLVVLFGVNCVDSARDLGLFEYCHWSYEIKMLSNPKQKFKIAKELDL